MVHKSINCFESIFLHKKEKAGQVFQFNIITLYYGRHEVFLRF